MIAKYIETPCNNRGFTLVELLVAMVMATIFILATMTIAEVSTQSYRTQERVSDAQQGVRGAMDMMVRDIRMAGYDPLAQSNGPTGGVGIVNATATNLVFSQDLNANGAIDGTDEQITYNYTGSQLQIRRGAAGNLETFIDQVTGFTFTYRDADGNITGTVANIAVVVVNMTVTATNSDGVAYGRTLTTRINCRNLRL